MYKKILFVVSLLVLVGLFGTSTAQAAAGPGWQDRLADATDTPLPWYETLDLEAADGNVIDNFGGCTIAPAFGKYQAHLLDSDTYAGVTYLRVRVKAAGVDNKKEGSWAVRVAINDAYYTELGCALNPAGGIVDFVVAVPAGKGVLVTIASHGIFVPESNPFETWITRGVGSNGGMIVDMSDDCTDDFDRRKIEVSTILGVTPAESWWFDDDDAFINNPEFWFLDVPNGTYNVGVQDSDLHFASYYPDVVFPGPGWWEVEPYCDANVSLHTEVDECGPQDGRVLLNVREPEFLFEDLYIGKLVNGEMDFHVSHTMAYGPEWDLVIYKDSDPENWLLVAQDIDELAGDLIFEVCTEASLVEICMDEDWDSGWIDIEVPGPLNMRTFDILPGAGPHGREACGPDEDCECALPGDCPELPEPTCEYIWLMNQYDCCIDIGAFEVMDVVLDNCEKLIEPPCSDECNEELGYPCDLGDLLVCTAAGVENGHCKLAKWYYHFLPTVNPWDTVVWGPSIDGEPNYSVTFGDGPFTTSPVPGVGAMEFPVGTSVYLKRGLWKDAFGNVITEVVDATLLDCDPPYALIERQVIPVYQVIENVTGDVKLSVSDWAVTDLGPITEIGRFMFTRFLEHGYLGDINGHESQYMDVCCDTGIAFWDCFECICTKWDYDVEFPHDSDNDGYLFAISPLDVRMGMHWSWSWVEAMYELDLTTGITPTTYGPETTMKRSEMAAFLTRLMKSYGLTAIAVPLPFADVPATYWAAEEIGFLRAYNITNGCDPAANLYCPEQPVLRAEIAKFLELTFRAIGTYKPGVITHWDVNQNVTYPGTTFIDVPSAHWANLWVEEMYFDGLTNGCTYGVYNPGVLYYCPNDVVTRAQMAKFVMDAIQPSVDTQGFWPVLSPER